MGEIYRAEDTKLKRVVAIKVLPAELVRDEEAQRRFLREAQAASALQHENICGIHEIGETPNGRMFICMDCYDGATLKERIAAGPLPVGETTDIAAQIAAGLSEAHAAKMVHRDIKPGNIMITRRGVAKILDFGLAKPAGSETLTKIGSTMGTAAYMSPEQARGDEVDHRTDVWSLGAVLYEMIAGRPPFQGRVRIGRPVLDRPRKPRARHGSPERRAAGAGENHREMSREGSGRAISDRGRFFGGSSPSEAGDFRGAVRPRSRRGAHPRERRAAGESRRSPRERGDTSRASRDIQRRGLRDRFAGGRRAGEPGRIESLAILPFVNVDRDPDTDYLSDEIPASITANLSRLSGLRVVPRSSAFRYRGAKGISPPWDASWTRAPSSRGRCGLAARISTFGPSSWTSRTTVNCGERTIRSNCRTFSRLRRIS